MSDAIKLSHKGLNATQVQTEMKKQMAHPAYKLFRDLQSKDYTTPKSAQKAAADAVAFPKWLKDNILSLSTEGCRVDLELENGAILTNTISLGDQTQRKFKPVARLAA